MNQEQLTQEQISAILYQYQQYQRQAEAITQQLNLIQMTLTDTEKAIETIEGMSKAEKGSESLIPIGAGSFIHVELTKPERTVVGVGAGICIEKPVEDAIKMLEKRKQEITKAMEQMQANLTKVTAELQKIQQALARIQQQSQAGQQPLTGM
jgi:prefoldin alpha subunit